MKIDSQIAVISGASKGLGAALATALVNKGLHVYGLARSEEKLKEMQQTLGDKFIPVVMDVSEQETISKWVEKTFSEKHSPDILINNAGVGHFSNIDEMPLEKWHQMINTNINGLFYMTSAFVPFMKKKESLCQIINIGSIMGKTTNAKSAAYSLTKYGVQGFSEALFKELRSFKIKVSCVNPGSIATEFFKDSKIQPQDWMLQPNELADLIVTILEMPENMLIDEITLRPLIPKKN